ncbi:hypothetical protein [Streptomyces sp. NPDC127098]|uniref:hypothetical protein n=1 Tax=Streptomyces sp. NPDC127098 TaxID=3347137 RepID=UPI00364A27D0
MSQRDVDQVRALLAAADPADEVSGVPGDLSRVVPEEATEAVGRRPGGASWRRAGRRRAAVAGGLLLAAAVAGAVLVALPGEGTGPGVAVLDGAGASERLPSWSATDWVSYADHVVVGALSSEREIAASEEELAAGEGYIGRSGTLDIRDVLWSRTGAQPAPASGLSLSLVGWTFGGDDRQRMAMAGVPRIETGHTYILTLAYASEGWELLGSGAILPYDEGVIGNGESAGTVRNADEAQAELAEAEWDLATEHSVEFQVTGHDGGTLVGLLASAEPDPAAARFGDLPADQRWERANG